MLQKQLLIAGSMLGALALGHQAVSADTVPTTTDTSRAQSVQSVQVPLPTVKAVVLSATDVTTSDASSTVDDGTTVHNGGVPNDDGTNTDNGGGSSSNDDGTNTDNGGSSSSSDSDSGSSSSNDNNNNGGSNTSNNGNTSHVVTVTPDNSGNAVNVPTQVASDADVSNAVKGYNQALTDNGKDASNEKVVQAKKNLDNAVAKALPKTHATEKSSVGGSGILALTMSGLIALGGLIYKRKHL
ncbi:MULTISPECIES: serine-rich aggregation substance UasX [Leuconostoc]|jgi:hypothetical protein|uniref:serine-rich aggregation substance UasX n=1 Tax=Leuconostoc TaxID=1243 RepID=UPI00190809A3|nr:MULTISPECIES: serine-rich aggregation substance UasX [Leuconostoc]MBK0040721.1 serine-rich aggregation substance UasX [Leuconostoc sp. S51]MBK0051857.1 serine-rich aggregation substance UasX [Leuconostoc sp. S50]MBS0958910.1 serine-rich aggregation substance UasX [Leuconostoc pseudomesenteroides]MDN2451871.1 hypothetical protein [Leuconostoc sp. UCMA20149]WAM37587.1 serine-rich aggregation substance UasX [Leuconostoc pseudomesenteroides]